MNINAYFLCPRICPHYNCLQAVFLNGTSMVIKINDLAQCSPHMREEVLHSIGLNQCLIRLWKTVGLFSLEQTCVTTDSNQYHGQHTKILGQSVKL